MHPNAPYPSTKIKKTGGTDASSDHKLHLHHGLKSLDLSPIFKNWLRMQLCSCLSCLTEATFLASLLI